MNAAFYAFAIRACLLAFALFGLIPIQPANAQTAQATPQDVTMATRVLPPFVTKEGAVYGGFSVDLWEAIAREANLRTTWREVGTVADILANVQSGQSQGAIAAISITAQREERFDFSQPMFDSGLQIMVRSEAATGLGLGQILSMFTTGAMPALLGLLALLILVPAHLAWLSERKQKDSIFHASYFPGIFSAIWWATGAAVGQQLDHPRSAAGRALSAAAILVSVIFVAYFTAAVTSAMTIQQLKGEIDGPEDLPGKRVATTTASTTATYLRSVNVVPVEFAQITQAFEALENKQVDAVVFDAPVLLYRAATLGKGKVRVVGPIFRKENYGILFPQGSPLRKPVNEALLKLRENGTYDRLYARWFSATATAN
ncbi:MAG: transporter substrate-binding domain-containing protein [Bosea sp. (in: a-proteobacteria)]